MGRPDAGDGLDLLRSDVRRNLYDHLADLPVQEVEGSQSLRHSGLSAQELADVVGLHLTTVRFHLDQLVAAGLLTTIQAPPSGAGRPRKLYAVPGVAMTPPSDPHALQAYAALSEIVATVDTRDEPLEQSPAALELSGREWARDHVSRLAVRIGQHAPAPTPGAWLGKIGAVLDLLVGWGHAPEIRTSSGAHEVDILLRDCPFIALARDSPQMVCGVHRGLLRGALDALGEESAELDLQPLIDHRTCRAHLTVTTPFPDRGES
ncbi:helix-turn-helix domain-containing protein [Ornithinimicrobium ciconiae]|uniref:Helix-turn-helix domain-containing protein n=1 Tax=Ornithinimicrobium ciconiae TaxID=2594265 RepID=A0A516GB17_9MICO|nr:helix-turn-helix domain-containing protein [Ornithinimicrobium ciconiae]QDO88709.1 helix-turn-helix domain-containing protein [Ornithinimicrobium ciconiae]